MSKGKSPESAVSVIVWCLFAAIILVGFLLGLGLLDLGSESEDDYYERQTMQDIRKTRDIGEVRDTLRRHHDPENY